MRQVFVFESVAVVVQGWNEPIDPPERGARVELRLLVNEPHRGSYAAAQRIVIDDPVFRADLFDLADGVPGNLERAHFHANFDGVEPDDRIWPEAIKKDPTGWLAGELGDLDHLLSRAGIDSVDGVTVARDAAALREATSAILAAVEATWESVRAPA